MYEVADNERDEEDVERLSIYRREWELGNITEDIGRRAETETNGLDVSNPAHNAPHAVAVPGGLAPDGSALNDHSDYHNVDVHNYHGECPTNSHQLTVRIVFAIKLKPINFHELRAHC